MKYLIDPNAPIMGQLRFMDMPEHLPAHEAIVYRFFDDGNRLLYLGVTVSPRGRWQAHKKTEWWASVRSVVVNHYPYARAALDVEDAAIKAERPAFNRRSVPGGAHA